jgi:tRNA-splicing ligase RtcB (3'-phosphate/5'-hydroxy nucleic acid ligase)
VTVHGAGRVMGRKQAAGVFDRKTGACKREGLVKPEMMQNWLREANVVLRGGGLDESPHCYKRLPEVIAEQGGTVRVLHTLTPVGVAMAGANEFDPYKD